MDIKNEILWRIYLVLLVLIVLASVIFIRTAYIMIQEGDEWRSKRDSVHIDMRPIKAERGSILARDGSFLATSLPYYEVRMDTRADAMTDKMFEENIDSLSACLVPWMKDRFPSKSDISFALREARKNNQRYFLIGKNVTYPDLQKIRTFPLFSLGPYAGGLIVNRQSKRQKPFRMLAHRTIGYIRENAQMVGLEGAYDPILKGEEGKMLMQRVAGGYWIPMKNIADIEPERGDDIVTTIDVNIQDVAGNALYNALKRHNADHGCVIVMEVKTGAIRAIANIGKTKRGTYWENYNYAIGASTEPGSTFKLATIMALLEDNAINLEDSINLNQGKAKFYEEEMVDASIHMLDSTSIRRAFEISSNVGMAKLTFENYQQKKRSQRFIDRLEQFHLHEKTGIELEGEGEPLVKSPENDSWSGTTIPWMSIGYELQLTPLQLLNFYNAVANDGRMMKPYLVSEVQRFGRTIETFSPEVIDNKIAKQTTIDKAKELLKGVVETGTANNIKPITYSIAGKTGTAQRNYSKIRGNGKLQYQASFAGFFPADNPAYSCIVVITDPKDGGFYGSQVAAPVFKEIADKCYARELATHPVVNENTPEPLNARSLPTYTLGYQADFFTSLNFLQLPYQKEKSSDWAAMDIDTSGTQLALKSINPKVSTVPEVRGMGIRDAVYLLENLGLEVVIKGAGKVKLQSIAPGTAIRGRRRIFLTLG